MVKAKPGAPRCRVGEVRFRAVRHSNSVSHDILAASSAASQSIIRKGTIKNRYIFINATYICAAGDSSSNRSRPEGMQSMLRDNYRGPPG